MVIYPHVRRSAFQGLFGSMLDDDTRATIGQLPEPVAAWLRAARFPAGTVFAMMPYAITIR